MMDSSLQTFFELSSDLLCIRGEDGYFKALNLPWERTLGWRLEELRSLPWLAFVHPDDVAITDDTDAQCHDKAASFPLEVTNRYRCKDGSYRWLSWRFSPYQDGLSHAIVQDMTEKSWRGSEIYRTQVQEALMLRDQAMAASSVGIVIADARLPDMPLIYVNPAFEQITGYSDIEVLGYNCRFLQGAKTDRATVDVLRRAIKAGENCTVTLLNYRKDGEPFWNELTISPIYDEKKKLTHFVGVQSDVSRRVQSEKALRVEKHKSEQLLLNVLPKPIVEKLKRVQGPVAEQFEEASILFADIVGFTPLSAQMPATDLVKLLNEVFSIFDDLAEKHGLEKIKTIGDAYMVAGGLPVPRADCTDAIAAMALEMQTAIQNFQIGTENPENPAAGKSLSLRIGINTGPVVAGVIGTQKFIYDLWGDTVNVANRMESQGKPGKIQVTAATYERLRDRFALERRGVIPVKGRGKMVTYWLLDRKR